mgnify:CR=1 FL=1
MTQRDKVTVTHKYNGMFLSAYFNIQVTKIVPEIIIFCIKIILN